MGGLVKAAGGFLGNTLEASGAKRMDAQETNPEAYSALYEDALRELNAVGNSADSKWRAEQSKQQRGALGGVLMDQIGGLEDNAAGRKQNFLEDQSRAFGADVQNLARAKGGTGTLAQALRPTSGMYDSQARATSRGLNDLYSQATQDLGTLSNVYGGFESQDIARRNQEQDRANSIAGVYQGELASRRGQINQNADNRFNTGVQQAKAHAGTLQAVGGMAGGAAGASDINLKKDIEPSEEELLQFLDSLTTYRYRYRDEKWGEGEQFSVMAQDLEKTPVGRAMVIDTPEGKMVNYGKGFGALLGAQVALNNRLKKLEAMVNG